MLDASCGAEPKSCGALMASLAQQLKSSSNCGPDLEQEQPLVARAYNGLIAYAPLYQAGCLKDSVGNYCASPPPPTRLTDKLSQALPRP